MKQQLLLCTDLDRTLLPNGTQPESPQARHWFTRLAALPQVTLVYVTGRHLALVEKAVEEYGLPQPHFMITDVGSTILENHEHAWRVDERWQQVLGADWKGKSGDDLAVLFADCPSLRLQEKEKQSVHKLSYYVPLEQEQGQLLGQMELRMTRLGIRARLVHSIDEQAGTALLDVLPAAAGKYQAIDYLMKGQGFDIMDTVFSGDSGNDLDVLASPVPSVLVANATDEVRDSAGKLACERGNSAALDFAGGGYRGMNGNYSAGILEGVMHFHPQAGQWLGAAT